MAQSCLTLCDPTDCSSPGSSVHGILWARILDTGWGLPGLSPGESSHPEIEPVSPEFPALAVEFFFFLTTESHGVAKSWTRLSYFTLTFHFHALEKEMATHSSILAWRVPGMGEPGGLPSMGSHRVGHDWSDLAAEAAAGKTLVKLKKLPEAPRRKHWGPKPM